MATRRFTPFDPGPPSGERADAARNRRAILDVAARLFRERGPEAVTLDEVAAEAGVGKGTIYRRFGDRSGLVMAVLDADDRELQDTILRGPPPLGPGAPVRERLGTFVGAHCDFIGRHAPLLAVAEGGAPGARYRSNLYASYRLHVAVLLREIAPEADCAVLADMVLAPLAADLYRHLREDGDVPHERIREGAVATALAIADRVAVVGG